MKIIWLQRICNKSKKSKRGQCIQATKCTEIIFIIEGSVEL